MTELLAAAVAPLPLLLAVGYAHGPMSRSRLTAFARHHGFTVTPDNGNQVIRYLAITRRWRCLGLGVSMSATLGWGMLHDAGGSVGALSAFAGWFVGALAAELHLAAVRHSTRRTASLRPREYQDYVGPFVWWLLPASAAATLPVLVVLMGQPSVGWPVAAAWLAVSLVVLAGAMAVRARVLLRPQPAAAPDAVRADDEIRSRSLHVLSGGGFALVCFCALAALDAVPDDPDIAALGFVAWLGVVIVGALSANARRRRPPAAALA
jgi:hypothetical protein